MSTLSTHTEHHLEPSSVSIRSIHRDFSICIPPAIDRNFPSPNELGHCHLTCFDNAYNRISKILTVIWSGFKYLDIANCIPIACVIISTSSDFSLNIDNMALSAGGCTSCSNTATWGAANPNLFSLISGSLFSSFDVCCG